MGQLSLLMVLLLLLVYPFQAQQRLLLDETIKLAHQRNIELQKQTANIKRAESEINKASRIPNPVFSYEREDLKSGSLKYNEWIASGSIPLNFLWNRWSKIDSKEKKYRVEELIYERLKSNITAKVSEVYYMLSNYTKLSNIFTEFIIELEKLSESAKLRMTEGDISKYEIERIILEVHKIKSTITGINILQKKYENELKLLTGLELDNNIIFELTDFNNNILLKEEELIKNAMANRKDLKAALILVESESLLLTHNKINIIPQMSLSAGYKEQADNLKGTVISVGVEIPLFERNQTEIEKGEIQLTLLNKELLFLKEKIKSDVLENHQNYLVNTSLYEMSKTTNLENIFSISVYSYEQGEISVVEFIDGINAYLDGLILNYNLENELIKSYYRLENAVGISFKNFENN